MALLKTQVVVKVRQTDFPRDYAVSNVWHTHDAALDPTGPDYQNHADEVLACFSGQAAGSNGNFNAYNGREIWAKVYDWADSKPRAPRAISHYVPSSFEGSALGPRDVQCCLSFYHSNPSIKTQRGRIYVGPFLLSDMHEHVPSARMDDLLVLGHNLFDVGGENIAHVIYSQKLGTTSVAQHYWVNDSWDTMRSRDTKETTREHLDP